MSSTRKYKKSFKKKSTTDYWNESEPQYTEEQKKRIASYLKENDENCKESTTLILIIVIGLLVALSIVGFLAIRNNSSVKYKGAHTTYEHPASNTSILNAVWSKWNWLQGLYFGLNLNSSNATSNQIYSGDATEMQAIVAIEEELNDFQPIYRNPLLQRLYALNAEQCNVASDDSVYNFISIKRGSWIPSKQYLEEALDFSWSDFETQAEKEEIELVKNEDEEDLTEKDKKERKQLQKQIEFDRKKRRDERKKKRLEERKKAKERMDKTAHKKRKGRRLLTKNKRFDPFHALPNPANILMPNKRGDKGEGDVEADALRMNNMDEIKKRFAGRVPGWVQNHGVLRGPRPKSPFRDRFAPKHKKYLKHLDEIQHKNRGHIKSPKDILSSIDLTKFGISSPISDETSDKEKRADLEKLEEAEEKRHPFMALLNNPGEISHTECVQNDDRRHEVIFSANGNDEDSASANVYNYEPNVLLWYCYLVEVEADAMSSLNGGSFVVNLTFSDVNMEVGYDYVDIYINSILTDSVSGIGQNWEENEAHPSFIYYISSDYVLRNGNALEVCMKIVTDSSVERDGFRSLFVVDFDDPQVTKWSKWSECKTKKPSGHNRNSKNEKHWNGDCGIGVRQKEVIECGAVNISDAAPCNLGQRIVEYCVKANCYDFALVDSFAENPQLAFKFNGHGRVDPDFADPFLVERSLRDSFNISEIMSELSLVLDEIIARYPDEKVLASAVINHYYSQQSGVRLGIRLARSLLLGDTFTVYTSGSSNTAGHENMFMASWPQQFQSIMRPVWKRVGFKGAAFRVRDHAEGGALSTSQLAPCIPSLIGDDADVVYWESQMNDHGDAISHAVENHLRNVITLPRRPMSHVMHAGKNQQGAACYDWICGKNANINSNGDCDDCLLARKYTEYGSGIVLFYPTAALAKVNKTKYGEFDTNYLYISWHPAPSGHRVYAEMLAYFYLTSVLETFDDIKDLIDDLTFDDIQKPIEEMLEILEDPPRSKQIPHDHVANKCDPVCTNATEAVCISGYETLANPRFSLKRWREKDAHDDDIGQWQYRSWMRNAAPFINKDGGQGSCDTKNEWSTNSVNSNEIKFKFRAQQYGYINIEGSKLELTQIVIKQIDDAATKTVHCGDAATIKDNWAANQNQCNIGGLKPYKKYEIIINVVDQTDEPVEIKNIRLY